MSELHISWWNLENLFDLEDASGRSEKLQRVLKKELQGWNQTVLEKKLTNLAGVINQINENAGPDLLGVCEVENKKVLEALKAKLKRSTYEIVHAESQDERGIDVAFIYDSAKLNAGEVFSHFILKRTATRDLLQVNFTLKENGRTLVMIGNHWPSRSGGTLESEPYRIIAGETLAYFHERIAAVLGKDTAIVALGDFNDAPHNRSLMDYALSTNSLTMINNAVSKHYFYNLMWSFLKNGEGTHYFEKQEVLDQFMVSQGISEGNSGLSLIDDSCRIERYPENMKHNKPRRFSRPNQSDFDEGGTSDHFPISFKLAVAK